MRWLGGPDRAGMRWLGGPETELHPFAIVDPQRAEERLTQHYTECVVRPALLALRTGTA